MNTPSKIEMIISSAERDIGGFTVRRILPYASHRMVGPFIFFDHMGPAVFAPGQGMDVRPHPHIGLATVTYLFEGKIKHRDSLGSVQDIEPGAVNWMTAGRGIVHSERTPSAERENGSKLSGIQLWVALPEDAEEIEPSFAHFPKDVLPQFKYQDGEVKLLLGKAFGHASPVPLNSDLFYAELFLKKDRQFKIPSEGRDSAVYVVQGQLTVDGQALGPSQMAIAKAGEDLTLRASEDAHLMIIGGTPVGERFIFWNFVASSKEKLETAKRLWLEGPSSSNPVFRLIPGDSSEFIPLPGSPPQPKGTIL